MQGLTKDDLRSAFPFAEVRQPQDLAFDEIVHAQSGLIMEMATGEGKTAVGLATLKAVAAKRKPLPVFYVTPTKVLVDELVSRHPQDTVPVYGRDDHPCLYYQAQGQEVTARESPCYMLQCPHRINMETGETEEEGAEPCPYYQQKYNALKAAAEGKVVVCTTAFFVLNRLKTNWRKLDVAAVVADEGHRLADICRRLFEYTFTDYHLGRLYAVMRRTLELQEQAEIIRNFLRVFRRICRKHPSQQERLLDEADIRKLADILDGLDHSLIERSVRRAFAEGPESSEFGDRELLKLLENLVFNVRTLINGLRYSLSAEDGEMPPLNYVVAFYRRKEEMDEKKRVQYELNIRSYYMAPIIRIALGEHPVVMSATVGNFDMFNWEMGLRRLRAASIPASFPVANTRMYVPSDVVELSVSRLGDRQYKRVLGQTMETVLRHATTFAQAGKRSLIVVISEEERRRMVELSAKFDGLDVVTYNDEITARRAGREFRDGRGHVLLGTAAQYGEGIDLPRQLAPVIFFLKPGYPNPEDPQSLFERRRFGNGVWGLWQWRVMVRAMQVRGRNIRSLDDMGVCFFVDGRFRKIVMGAAPDWLKPAYRGNMAFSEGVQDTLKLLG